MRAEGVEKALASIEAEVRHIERKEDLLLAQVEDLQRDVKRLTDQRDELRAEVDALKKGVAVGPE